MRGYRFLAEVHDIPLQFNFLGFRVSLPVIMILLADFVIAVAALVICNQFLEDKAFTISFIVIVVIAVIILLVVMWWVASLSRLSTTLPVEKQLRLLRETAKLPVWTGIESIDGDKKEQIR